MANLTKMAYLAKMANLAKKLWQKICHVFGKYSNWMPEVRALGDLRF